VTVELTKQELKRLRQGPGLAHPSSVLRLDGSLRHHLTGRPDELSSADEIVDLVGRLRRHVSEMTPHERIYAEVDLNLAAEHSFPSLTERQESLAAAMGCASKTVRRHSERAMETLAVLIATDRRSTAGTPRTSPVKSPIEMNQPIAMHVAQSPDLPSGQIGRDFEMIAPTVEFGNPVIKPFTLPNPERGRLLDLTWETFGRGVERLKHQIKNLGRRLDVDICFGINEAGLVMATFLASAQFSRCPIGYLRCNKVRDQIGLDSASFFPQVRESPTIVLCDFEVKHADVIGVIVREIRNRYPGAELYFAVFGAMVREEDLVAKDFDDLTGGRIMEAADFEAVFIAATMAPPGIEPPLELR
jgi:hypothetical protein